MRNAKLVAAFQKFHRENPHIYELFKQFTQMLIFRGFKHHSSDAVLHRIRWYTNVETTNGGPFKINNNWSAFYARLFERDHPQYAGFFRNRESAADSSGLEAAEQSLLSLG